MCCSNCGESNYRLVEHNWFNSTVACIECGMMFIVTYDIAMRLLNNSRKVLNDPIGAAGSALDAIGDLVFGKY